MKKLIMLLSVILVLTSCARFKGSKMVHVSPGMTKAEVVHALGKPNSVGGSGNVEVLHYAEDIGWWRLRYYFVRLVDGKVESYGPEGDRATVTENEPPLKMPNKASTSDPKN
jgi:hypothetical protein